MEDFESLYMCNFEPSEFDRLVDEIVKCNKVAERMSTKDAINERRRLREWIKCSGYSSDEYQQAKKVASGIRY